MALYTTVMREAYQAALKEHWNEMIGAYRGKTNIYVMSPLTVSADTPFHLAVYSKSVEPLQSLLDIRDANPRLENPCKKTNAYGNTILHEAVVAGNMEAVELLLRFVPKGSAGEYDPSELLQTTNVLGETPLYRAASSGKKEIVEYLAKLPGQISEGKLLIEKHRKRKDLKPILHAAIQGQHFETALTLLKLDQSLHELEDEQGMTCLHILADMPSAFKSGYPQRTISVRKLFYLCFPPAGGDRDWRWCKIGWAPLEKIRKDKHKHESALELAKELIEMNQRYWWQSISVKPTEVNIKTPGQGVRGRQSERQGGAQGGGGDSREGGGRGGEGEGNGGQEGVDPGRGGGGGEAESNENVQPKIEQNRRHASPPPNPLFIATSNGILEIVNEILKKFPQGIELVNEVGMNVLHVAVMHRQKEIFRLIKKKNILMARLSSRIDNNGNTLLHQVSHVKHYRGGTKPGPALQLQEEIKWFKRVQKIVPPYHASQRNKEHKMTPNELFQYEHQKQLKMAQDWIEKTSQSCSAVAVLVATVVFAAAYTIPGGSDDHGFPIFLHNRFFLAFTIMDVIALASSLTSVVMFLSILTTPFECEKFYHNIPRKLICGFTLLFFSVMTTMLAFACTLFLVIRLRKQWTTGLISIAAFLPVTVFAAMQFPLYIAFFSTMKDFFKEVGKSLPWFHFPFRSRQGKTKRQR